MSRKARAARKEIKPYLSAHLDGHEKRFIQVGNTLMLSKEFQQLTLSGRWLYFSLAMEAGGKPTATISRRNAKKYGIPTSTFDRAIRELQETGFICVDGDDMHQFSTKTYRFIDAWKVA